MLVSFLASILELPGVDTLLLNSSCVEQLLLFCGLV